MWRVLVVMSPLWLAGCQGSCSALGDVGLGEPALGGNSLGPSSMGAGSANPLLFRALDGDSGISNLSTSITINGQTVTASFAYRGQDADASTWTALVGDNLGIAGSGTAPTTGAGVPFTDDTQAVDFAAGQYYGADPSTTADLGTDDYVLEAVIALADESSDKRLVDAIRTAAPTEGVMLAQDSAESAYMATYCDGASAIVNASSLGADVWHHVMFFVDRSGSGVAYVNGAARTATSVSSLAACDIDVGRISLGASNTAKPQARVAWAAMWHAPSWLDTHLQADLAAERFSRLAGSYPRVARGQAVPKTDTRASIAVIDIIDTSTDVVSLYTVGAEWVPRVGRRKTSGGSYLIGMLREGSSTNLALQSNDLSTTWAPVNASVQTASDTDPFGGTAANGIVGDATDAVHCVAQDVTLTAAVHAFSAVVKEGDQTHAYLDVSTIANAYAYVDPSACTLGTVGGAATGSVTNLGNGWCRVTIAYTGTAASHTHRICGAQANGDNVYTGDASTVNIHALAAQVELSTDKLASSIIATTTASVTRSADRLTYKGDNGNTPGARGAAEITVLLPSTSTARRRDLLSLYDGGRLLFYAPTSDQVDFYSETAGVGLLWSFDVNTTDITDASAHTLRGAWEVDNVRTWFDGVAGGTATTAPNMPARSKDIDPGAEYGGTGTFSVGGLVRNVRIWNRPLSPSEAP